MLKGLGFLRVEAEEIVDLVLIENAVIAGPAAPLLGGIAVDHRGPVRREFVPTPFDTCLAAVGAERVHIGVAGALLLKRCAPGGCEIVLIVEIVVGH